MGKMMVTLSKALLYIIANPVASMTDIVMFCYLKPPIAPNTLARRSLPVATKRKDKNRRSVCQ